MTTDSLPPTPRASLDALRADEMIVTRPSDQNEEPTPDVALATHTNGEG